MEKFEIGSKIFKSSKWSSSFERIERETNTMWITENNRTRIYKKNNSVVGGNSSIVLAKQEHYNIKEKSSLAYKIREFNFDKLEVEQLIKIQAIIDNKYIS